MTLVVSILATAAIVFCFCFPFILNLQWQLRDARVESKTAQQAQSVLVSELEQSKFSEQVTYKRYHDLLGVIETINSERDQWRDLYWEQSREHGNAQSLLLEERSRLVHQIRSLGKTPSVNGVIERICAEFAESHQVPDPEYDRIRKEKHGQ
jgi:hypothetical protein